MWSLASGCLRSGADPPLSGRAERHAQRRLRRSRPRRSAARGAGRPGVGPGICAFVVMGPDDSDSGREGKCKLTSSGGAGSVPALERLAPGSLGRAGRLRGRWMRNASRVGKQTNLGSDGSLAAFERTCRRGNSAEARPALPFSDADLPAPPFAGPDPASALGNGPGDPPAGGRGASLRGGSGVSISIRCRGCRPPPRPP